MGKTGATKPYICEKSYQKFLTISIYLYSILLSFYQSLYIGNVLIVTHIWSSIRDVEYHFAEIISKNALHLLIDLPASLEHASQALFLPHRLSDSHIDNSSHSHVGKQDVLTPQPPWDVVHLQSNSDTLALFLARLVWQAVSRMTIRVLIRGKGS